MKGLSGNKISVELTANEYTQMKRCRDKYRVCIVTNALKKQILSIYRFNRKTYGWENEDGKPITVQSVMVEVAKLYV